MQTSKSRRTPPFFFFFFTGVPANCPLLPRSGTVLQKRDPFPSLSLEVKARFPPPKKTGQIWFLPTDGYRVLSSCSHIGIPFLFPFLGLSALIAVVLSPPKRAHQLPFFSPPPLCRAPRSLFLWPLYRRRSLSPDKEHSKGGRLKRLPFFFLFGCFLFPPPLPPIQRSIFRTHFHARFFFLFINKASKIGKPPFLSYLPDFSSLTTDPFPPFFSGRRKTPFPNRKPFLQ